MKNIVNVLFVSLCITVLVSACKKDEKTAPAPKKAPVATKPVPPAPPPKVEEKPAVEKKDPLASFKACWAAYNKKDDVALGKCYDEKSEWTMVDFTPPMSGKGTEASLAAVKGIWKAFPDINSEPQLVLHNGNKFASIILTQGTNSGDFMGKPATNKKISIYETQLVSYNETGAVEMAQFLTDHSVMAHQLGLHKGERAPDAETAWPEKLWITAKNDEVEKKNVAFVEQMAEKLLAGDHKAVLANIAEDIHFRYVGDKEPMKGIKAYKQGYKKWTDMAEHKGTPIEIWGAGDWVVAVKDNVHTFKKDFPGAKGTKGKEVKTRTIEFMQIAEDKIKNHWVFENSMAYAIQLGMIKVDETADKGGAMGKMKDKAMDTMDKAKDKAKETVDKAKDKAKETMDKAKDKKGALKKKY